jgi:hypothetical protein
VRVVEEGADERELREVSSRLRNLAERATDVRAEWIVEVGHPADRLVAVARREGASFVVVGSTGPHASLLGSISADVSRRAPCPVVVVGLGSDAAFGEEPGGGGVSERHPFPRPKERRTNGARSEELAEHHSARHRRRHCVRLVTHVNREARRQAVDAR